MTLRSVSELAASEQGREQLEEFGVYTDPERFRAALRPPARAELAERLGVALDRNLIYIGQQIAADFTHATATKFTATREVQAPDLECALIWHDMDRAGSDRYALRVVLELGGSRKGMWLAPRKYEDREPRFIPAEGERIEELLRHARNATDGLPRKRRAVAQENLERLAVILRDAVPGTVADAGRALSMALLNEHLGLRMPSVFVSELANEGLLHESLLRVLAALDEVVAVFNDQVEQLVESGIDPQVGPLDKHYLPLWYSCPESGRRVRLKREQRGHDRFGVASCSCGKQHRFHLGDGAPSLEELEQTGRWSPDVLLPALHDDLVSGYIAGRSSALYGIVLRAIISGPLGGEPTPAFLPSALLTAPESPPQPDSLLHAYLAG